MSIELHCHSLFSVDAFETPEAVVDAAAAHDVRILSLTEHNHLGSMRRAAARAAIHGIRYIPGIELDAFFGEHVYHFLGFGFDPAHSGLRALTKRNHACYAIRFETYYRELLALGFPWQRQELEEHLALRYPTHPAPVLSNYFLSHFMAHWGELDGFNEMHVEALSRVAAKKTATPTGACPRGVVQSDRFCDFTEARDAVHAAGGRILLAHVGKYLPNRHQEQTALIRRLHDQGLDGFELHHPVNAVACRLDELTELAQALGCLLSGGSDCHRVPGSPPKVIGSCGAPDDLLAPLLAAIGDQHLYSIEDKKF